MSSPVALFTGATAGIGEGCLKAYAEAHPDARIYFVGRNEERQKRIVDDVRRTLVEKHGRTAEEINVVFIRADLSLLANCENVAQEIEKREGKKGKLDFLCMTQGYVTLRSRQDSSEGLDVPFVLQCTSRIFLAHRFLPLLQRSDLPNGGKVVSVHAPFVHTGFFLDDIGLERRHSSDIFEWIFPGWFRSLTALDPSVAKWRQNHSSITTTLFFEELAKHSREMASAAQQQTPPVTLLHVWPGLVKTKEFSRGDFPAVLKFFFTRIMLPLLSPWLVEAAQVGNGVVALVDSPEFGNVYLTTQEDGHVAARVFAIGSDGTKGSGSYCLTWDGKATCAGNVVQSLRSKGANKVIWEYYKRLFGKTSPEYVMYRD